MDITIEFKVKTGRFQELYQTLLALLPLLRREKGYLDCRVSGYDVGEETLLLSVSWTSQSDLEYYIQSNSGSALLGAMELLCKQVKIRVGRDRDASWEGPEILKKMRQMK